MASIEAEREFAVKGGIWSEENLEQSLDWAGESGSSKAALLSDVTHSPKSRRQIENEVLEANSVSAEVLAIIVSRVQQSILSASGSAEQTLIQMVDDKISRHSKEVQQWMDAQGTRIVEVESKTKESSSLKYDKLEERLVALEFKVDALTGSITTHGAEETRMIHEAYKIISERRSTDDGETSEPSIYGRMEQRLTNLQDQLKSIEPLADKGLQASVTLAKQKVNVRSKFGRMM